MFGYVKLWGSFSMKMSKSSFQILLTLQAQLEDLWSDQRPPPGPLKFEEALTCRA